MPRGSVPQPIERQITAYEGVAEVETQARENPEDSNVLSRLGLRYLQSGSAGPAITTLERALALDPQNDRAQLALGQAYGLQGETERAGEAYEAYLERNPEDTRALNLIGYNWLQSDPERAITYFLRYAEVDPTDPNAHDSLGEGYLTAGRLDEAAAEYERAIALDAGFTNSYFMLGQVYQQLSRREEAISAYQRFIEQSAGADPRVPQAEAALRELGVTG
jgi:tetratricopeptide (TPR) repeat protein